MKPVGPEQILDTHKHDYISLCVSNFKKYKQMKQAMPEIIIEMHKIMIINSAR
ncbi:MAG: hypothetical protein MI975_03745 [Cytophagales bacterium]|nr:hypothetical protein [Cytophagales bacterium]